MSGGFARPLAAHRNSAPARYGGEDASGLALPLSALGVHAVSCPTEDSPAPFAPSLSRIPSLSTTSSGGKPFPTDVAFVSEDSTLASPRRVTPATTELERYTPQMDGSGGGPKSPYASAKSMPQPAPSKAYAPQRLDAHRHTAGPPGAAAHYESSLLAPRHLDAPTNDPPPEFVCPLSRRVMVHPVVAANGHYKDDGATLDDLREAVTTLEETEITARRVFGGGHPTVYLIVQSLPEARAALHARETPSTT